MNNINNKLGIYFHSVTEKENGWLFPVFAQGDSIRIIADIGVNVNMLYRNIFAKYNILCTRAADRVYLLRTETCST